MAAKYQAIVFTAIFCCGLSEALACSMPAKARPTIYELESASGELVLAIVEDPQRYTLIRYEPTPSERALLDRYPVNGIYRNDSVEPVLIHAIAPVLEKNKILGLFEDSGGIYLVETNTAWFTIWENGEILRSLNDAETLGWFAAPWAYVLECGARLPVEFDLTSRDSSHAIRVRTGEGAEFLYSATTGELLSESKPSLRPAEEATAAEAEVASIVAGWSQMALVGNFKGVADSWNRYLSDLLLAGCSFVEARRGANSFDSSQELDGFPAGPEAEATGAQIYAAPRLQHSLDSTVDLYRVESDLGRAMCSMPFELSPELIAQIVAASDDREAGQLLLERLGQPAILAVTSWPAPPPSGPFDDDLSRFGSVTAWTLTEEGWRIFAFHQFAAP